jgi:hypothetical protein
MGVLWGFSAEDQLRKWPHDVLVRTPDELYDFGCGAAESLTG